MLSIIVLASVLLPQESEPARILKLVIDGQEHLVEEGAQIQIVGQFSEPRIRVVPTPFRQFKYGGMSFRYPAFMRFETDHELGVRNWTMLGRTADLDVYEAPLSAEKFLQQYVDAFVAASGVPNQTPDLETATVEVQGRRLQTWQYRLQLGEDDSHSFWVLELPPLNEKVRLLMFDLEYQDGALTAETVRLKATVMESLQFQPE